MKSTLDLKETAHNNAQVDRAIEAASRSVESLCHRRFYPTIGTRRFDWPGEQRAMPWRLWLGSNDLISVTSMTSGGTEIAASDFFLRRSDDLDEPPYTRVELDLDSSATFGRGSTHQRDITITGLWGYSQDETNVGAVADGLDGSVTAIHVDGDTAAAVGVGSVLRLGSERLVVMERGTLTTAQALQWDLDALDSEVTVTVTTGTSFTVGETILLDSERMLIVDIAGNSLTVIRAWDGSVLAAHSASTIYAYRALTVQRGALGTPATTHSAGSAVYRWDAPGLVRDLAMAEAINTLLQGSAGYSGVSGSDNNRRRMSSPELVVMRQAVYDALGRKGRTGAI
ncbi:hypothetical protein ACFO9E_18175 [Streptomyces maoxianensis]|uniref:Uncharacterized protein n=1 Tax=Streptomyces maoxianensis TaxID=1459942 RepID=A0ABV9G5X6_9ACTN